MFLLVSVTGYLVNIEIVKGAEEIILFVEDGRPGKTGLVDIQDEPGEKMIVVVNGKSILVVVIMHVHIVLFHFSDDGAITGEFFHRFASFSISISCQDTPVSLFFFLSHPPFRQRSSYSRPRLPMPRQSPDYRKIPLPAVMIPRPCFRRGVIMTCTWLPPRLIDRPPPPIVRNAPTIPSL